MDDNVSIKYRTCTMCGKIVETFSEIVYSQGELVCLECKTITSPIDKIAYDNYITSQ